MKQPRGRRRKENPFVCKHHGEMPAENFLLEIRIGRPAYYRCLLCKRETQKNTWHRNKKSYRPARGSPRWREQQEIKNLRKRKLREALSDGEVREQLKRSGFNMNEITPEMIEIKRAMMKMKRIKSKLSEQQCERS